MSEHADEERNVCSFKTEPEEGSSEIMGHDSTTFTFRGPSPLSDSMEENAVSTDMNGADLQSTLGEILAYCQVTYGAVLKLDEKFEMLQAKVTSIQTLHMNPALLSQKTEVSSSYTDSLKLNTASSLTPDTASSMPHLDHKSSSSPLSPVESMKPLTPSTGPEFPSPPWLDFQNQSLDKPSETPHNSTEVPSLNMNKTTLMQQQQQEVKSSTHTSSRTSNSVSSTALEKTRCLGSSERKVFLPSSVLKTAAKMPQPSSAVRFLLRSIFTVEELSQSNTTGNPARSLKRLDPNKINAIREWAVKRYPKFDLRARGKDWRACLSVMNSSARYYRFINKTRKLKMKVKEAVTESEPAAEIDVELSDSDSEQKQQRRLKSRTKTSTDCDAPADSDSNSVYLGPPHREVKVPLFAMSTAQQRTRPELIARYLIKFIFPEDVLIRSNVYGNTDHGIQPLDPNKLSALREHLLERFPWMRLEEGGHDWKVCVGAINSSIRKFRYDRKMGKR